MGDFYPGFFIVRPHRKLRSFAEFTPEEGEEFIKLVMKLRRGMDEVLVIKDVYFFQREDTSHNFHVWCFPRYDWMEKFGRKIKSVTPIIDYSKENMVNDNVFHEVRESVEKMKEYMKVFS